MKMRRIITILSFLICFGICFFSNLYVVKSMNGVIEAAEKIEKHLKENNTEKAREASDALKKYIEKRQSLLEGLVPHEDLHDLSVQIADAVLSIKIHDLDDCKKALSLMKENADHLINHESFLLGNVF